MLSIQRTYQNYILALLAIIAIYWLIITMSDEPEAESPKINQIITYKEPLSLEFKYVSPFEDLPKDSLMARKINLLNFCINNEVNVKYPGNETKIDQNLIIDRINGITWCPVLEAGSTNWMELFAKIGMEGDSNLKTLNRDPDLIARKAFPYVKFDDGMKEIIDETKKFIIVRHPFQRLLSAFQKTVEDTTNALYDKLRIDIIETYRGIQNEKVAPTFLEFVKYLVNQTEFDGHWRPYYLECAPCFVNFDVILKLETIERDEEYLLKYLDIEQVKQLYIDSQNNAKLHEMDQKYEYYSKIPKDLLQSLYAVYKLDFSMFDYEADEYFAIAEESMS